MPARKKTEGSAPRSKKAAPSRSEVEQALDGMSEDALHNLFGDKLNAGEIAQISFNDVREGGKKNETVLTYRPKEYVKTGDRISSGIVEGFEKGEAEYHTRRRGSAEQTVTRVNFIYKNVDIYAPRDGTDDGFTSLDKEVHDAVVSLYAAGNKVFSPAMVYRTMAGKADSAFVPPEKLREVISSIQKCMSSIITIDTSEESAAYSSFEAVYSQNLIYAKQVTLRMKGWEVSAFMLIDEPVLYRYAKMKNQVFSVPLRVLDSPPSKTNDVIVLQGYLIRVVETLRRQSDPDGLSNEIPYRTLYEQLGYQDASKQKLLRVRGNIRSILDYWVSIGYIRGYEEITQERIKYSILLDVEPQKLLEAVSVE